MIKKLSIIETIVSNKKHINSSFFLFFINFFNFIFPLLISPIIIQRCGLEGFGVVVLFQSIAIFVSSLTDYGFNVNATREVTLKNDDPKYINRYFFTVSYTKAFLLSVAILLCIVIFLLFPKAGEYSILYWSSICILVGRAFNPLWILRAIHKMSYVFYFYVFFKLLCIILIYFFLQDKSDLYMVNLSIGFSDLFTSLFAVLLLIYKKKWSHHLPSYQAIKRELMAGIGIFIQVISINANAYLNPVILGMFVDEYSLGIYCVVEKIILAVKFCFAFVTQSIFPKACEISIESEEKYRLFSRKLFMVLTTGTVGTVFILYIFSGTIVSYFVKGNIDACQELLKYNSWIPLIVVLNMVPYMTFLVHGKYTSVTHVIIFSVCLNLIVNTILSKMYGIYGISTGIYITELFISIYLWAILIFKYPNYNFMKR